MTYHDLPRALLAHWGFTAVSVFFGFVLGVAFGILLSRRPRLSDVYKRQNGGWALGCRIDGGQAEYVRVPYADQGLNVIPDGEMCIRDSKNGRADVTFGRWAARNVIIRASAVKFGLAKGKPCGIICSGKQ